MFEKLVLIKSIFDMTIDMNEFNKINSYEIKSFQLKP